MSEIRYNSGKEQFIDGFQSNTEILLKEIPTPSPTTGYGKMYAKNDGKVYYLDSDGSENLIGSTGNLNQDILAKYFYSSVPTSIANTISIGKLYCRSSDNTVDMGFDNTNITISDPVYQWLFDEGTGTTIPEVNNTNTLTISGAGYTWGTGYLQTNTPTATYWSGQTGVMTQLDSFSYYLWTSINNVSATGTRYYLVLGSGAVAANTTLSVTLFTTAAAKINCAIIDGSSNDTIINIPTTSFSPSSDEKFLVCFTYTRVGGATNNIMKIRVTKDGVNWYEASSNTTLLMRKSNTFSWRSSGFADASTSYNRYYRFGVYPNKILSDLEMQTIWDAGSEGNIVSHITQTVSNKGKTLDLTEKPYTFLFKENGGNRISDEKGYANSTLSGTYTWGTNGLSINGVSNATNRFSLPAGYLNEACSFSLAAWVTFNTAPTTTSQYRSILVLGADSTANASNAVMFGIAASSQPGFLIGDGTSLAGATISGAPFTIGVKYLVVGTYQRIGTGSINPTSLYITSNGVDWYTATALAPLMQVNSSYAWRSNYPNTANSCDLTYHRVEFYRNTVLTADNIQSLWNSGSDALYEVIPDEFTFNEGSGTTVTGTKNLTNLTLSGTTSWGSGSLTVVGSTTGRIIGSTNTYTTQQSFSIAAWITLSTPNTGSTQNFLAVGDGTTNGAGGYSWVAGVTSTGAATVFISNGTITTNITTTQVIPSNTKILYVLTYTRIGGSNNNILKIRWTSDGSNWYESTSSTAVLLTLATTGFALRNNQAIAATADATYHKISIYQNQVLSNSDIQTLWDNGSESVYTPTNYGGINSVTISPYLNGIISSSGTTVTGVGTSFITDFKVDDILYTRNMGRRITNITSDTTLTIDTAFEVNIPARSLYQRGGYAPNTHFYTYVISDTNNTHLIASSRSVDNQVDDVFPTNYTKYRQLPLTIRTETDCLPFRIAGGWPNNPTIIYNTPFNPTPTMVNRTIITSTFSATVATLIDISKYVSPLSTRPMFYLWNTSGTTSFTSSPTTSESFGNLQTITSNGFVLSAVPANCSSNQSISLRVGAAQNHIISIYGYTITSDVL